MEKSVKNSMFLKALCYILLPILVCILILSFIYTAYIAENEEVLQKDKFEETNIFADTYITAIGRVYEKMRWVDSNFSQYTDEIYLADRYYKASEQIRYLVIDTRTGIAYTNMDLQGNIYSVDELREKITKNEDISYCHFVGATQETSTNIDNNRIEQLTASYISNYLEKYNYYDIYTTINEVSSINNEFFIQEILFNMIKNMENIPIILIPLLILLIVVMLIYLLVSIGHKRNYQGIYLNSFDELPIELTGIGAIILICLPFVMDIYNIGYSVVENIILTTIILMVAIFEYCILALIGTTIVKKLKSHTLWKSSLTYKTIKWIVTTIKNIKDKIFSNFSMNIKIAAAFLGTILVSIILLQTDGIGVLLTLALWAYELWFIIKHTNSFMKIKKTLENIYNGKTDNKLNEEEFKGELKEVSKYINDIQSGFSNAIEESLKSERMKTELITNVSHDIKTPLTSIINYVDLLKSEEINNDKAKEYIGVLDSKSQRLKKLIEDLVEASKASSGNIKLNIEKINLVELINQTTGEFEDKFKEKNLIIDINTSEDKIYINADNRYMYRVIENVFSNISKYALEGSRVYIDVIEDNKQSKITIKNISKDKLNITAEELMQRFVRGDKSRTTEGSGLGLSISQSLTELQNGKFDITIDGDLFKVEIVFNK